MKFWLLIWLCSFSVSNSHAQESQFYIDVGQAQVKKSLLALTPLVYSGTQPTNRMHIDVGQSLYRIIYNDLSVSGFFVFVKPEAYLEDPNKVGLRPAPGTAGGFDFQKWKTVGSEFLFRAAYQVIGEDLTLEVYVYHVPTTKLVMGKSYKAPISASRRIGHSFANDLMLAITGKKGMFLTKVVASRQEMKGTSIKEIFVLDWDGANPQKITSHKGIAISPAWSTKGDKISYTAFVHHRVNKINNSDLFIYEMNTGRRYLVSYKKGMNSGAAFFPGDQQMVLTLSHQGSPDLYRINIDGAGIAPLTRGPNRAMNVEPAVSPDGKRIAFSSDRSGRPMVYVMNSDGSGVRRLTFAGKYNSTPSWSPDGKMLAFAALDRDHFDIFTMNVDGTNLRRMTDARKPNGRAANNESPSWSPDGRHILFTSDRTGKYQLYIVSPDGTNERRITEDGYNWDKPKWSPYLE